MKKNRDARIIYAILSGLLLCLALPGCVSRSAYDQNMSAVLRKLQVERAEKNEAVQKLEQKVQDRGKSLNELTARYMDLQKEHEKSQVRLNRFKSDLEVLLRDMAELKMVIFTNVKGTQANEMMIKLMEMQNRVQLILGKAAEKADDERPSGQEPAVQEISR